MNPNTIPWLHYQDIQTDDIALRSQFDNYMRNGEYVEAIRLLRTSNEQLKGKAYIADTVTTIMNGLKNLQDKFNTGVNLFMSNLATRYTNLIDNTKKIGEWNSVITYIPYNFVSYQEEIYMAIDDVPVGTLPTDEVYWLKLGLRGADGADGVDVNLQYVWNVDTAYKDRDLVSYDTALYLALKDNVGVRPDTDPNTWLPFLIAAKGQINVGVNPPANPEIDTIWFQTESDPLEATSFVQGQFNRYTRVDTWEPMYPSVLFTWVEGVEKYAPYAKYEDRIIKKNRWIKMGNKYEYNIYSVNVGDGSFVEIAPGFGLTEAQMEAYGSMTVEVSEYSIKLIADMRPEASFDIRIKIQ